MNPEESGLCPESGLRQAKAPRKIRLSQNAVVIGFYGSMSLIGLGLIGWRIEDPAFNPFGFPGNDFLRGGTAAVLFVLLVVALTALSFRSMATVRRSARMIQTALGPLTPARIILLASLSGIGEELLFRGWLLNETGLLVSSIIFGAFHIRWDRDLIYWPFFAFAVGLVLGLFCLWTNTLYWAVLVHAGINGLNLYQISRQDRRSARGLRGQGRLSGQAR